MPTHQWVPLWPLLSLFTTFFLLCSVIGWSKLSAIPPINRLVNSFRGFQETLIIRDWCPPHVVLQNMYSENHLPPWESQDCSMKGSCAEEPPMVNDKVKSLSQVTSTAHVDRMCCPAKFWPYGNYWAKEVVMVVCLPTKYMFFIV